MKIKQTLAILVPVGLMLPSSGCVLEYGAPADSGDDGRVFEELLAEPSQELDTDALAVDGDILGEIEQQDEEDYEPGSDPAQADNHTLAAQLTGIRVHLHTGNDDKRDDTYVRLDLQVAEGDATRWRYFMLSPKGQRLGDRSEHIVEFALTASITPAQIIGCRLKVNLGESDGWFRHRDNWWMTGLEIEGKRNGSYEPLLDYGDWRHKFVEDKKLACPEAAPLQGMYRGPIWGDHGTKSSLTATFSGGPSRATAAVSIAAGLKFDCFGAHPIGAPSFTLTGRRKSVSSDGKSHYTLTGSLDANGHTIGVRVEGDLHNSTFNGVAHLDGPFWCDKSWSFQLDQR